MLAPNGVIPPSLGQKTGRQNSTIIGGLYYAGGYVDTGFVTPDVQTAPNAAVASDFYPNWGSFLVGSFINYRRMLRHPTIAYIISQILAPVYASMWQPDADQDADPAALAWLQQNVIQHRATIVPHALNSIIFGFSPFEIVWNTVSGQYVIDRYVPLLQDITRVLRSNKGQGPIVGLRNKGVDIPLTSVLNIMNQADALGSEPGNDYGRSRLENVRDTAWVEWLNTARRLAELEDRASGVVPIIIVPKGVGSNNKSLLENAIPLLQSLSHPRSIGAVLETPVIGEEEMLTDPKAAKQLTTQVTPFDLSNRAPSQQAMHQKLQYLDNLMARGLCRGERSVFATAGGIKADSEQHSENAEPDAESIDAMIVKQVNEGPVRNGLTLNFGEKILEKIRGVKPTPLVDRERIAAVNLLKAIFMNTATASTALAMTDVTKLWDAGGLVPAKDAEQTYKKFVEHILKNGMQPVPGEPNAAQPEKKAA